MCIIAIKPEGQKMFSKATLKTMFTNNPDGAGFMFYDEEAHAVVYEKGYLTFDSLWIRLRTLNLKDTTAVLHFRIGTSGYLDKLNCHPYPVRQKNADHGTTDLAVAHNGILSDYTPSKSSKINDTQVFINTVLNKLNKGFEKDTDKCMLIGELIGSNKLAFLNNDGELHLIGDFIKDDGYIYSNYSYMPRPAKTNYTHYSYKDLMDELWDDGDDWEKDWD